jgi:hypothetical protein
VSRVILNLDVLDVVLVRAARGYCIAAEITGANVIGKAGEKGAPSSALVRDPRFQNFWDGYLLHPAAFRERFHQDLE